MKDHRMGDYWAEGDIEADSADTTTKGTVVYHYPSGRKERVTADPAVRNHNPGNLKYGTKQAAIDAGALTVDQGGFAVFPDWLTGMAAADAWWDGKRKKGSTIEQAVHDFTETDREQRIKDLLNKAKGYRDKDGNPVDRHTPLSKLSDDQFATLRTYNNRQLEGWLNGLDTAHIEIIPAPDPKKGQGGTQQAPTGKIPIRSGKNHSSLELPWASDPLASISAGDPWAGGAPAPENLLLSATHHRTTPRRGPAGSFSMPTETDRPARTTHSLSHPLPLPLRPPKAMVPHLLPSRPGSGTCSSPRPTRSESRTREGMRRPRPREADQGYPFRQ